MQDMQVDSGYFASKTEISQYGIMYELCQDEAEEIEIPRLSYVRYTDSGLFSSKEVICYYELSSAAIIPAIDVSLVMSNMASEIPIQIGLVGEHAPNEISMDIGLSTVGWHGTYPSCQTPNCAIPAQLGQKTSVLLKYVPENASTSSAKPAAGS